MSPQADCFKSAANEAHLASGQTILPRIARVAAIGLPSADKATASEYAFRPFCKQYVNRRHSTHVRKT